jgi:hypothetical protein
MERETGIEPATNSLEECVSIAKQRLQRSWRAILTTDTHRVHTFGRAVRHGAPAPRVINTNLAPTYPTAISGPAALGRPAAPLPAPARAAPHNTSPVGKGTHCGKAGLPGGSARRAVDDYEAIHQIRKRQVRWLPACDIVRHNLYIDRSSGPSLTHLNLSGTARRFA